MELAKISKEDVTKIKKTINLLSKILADLKIEYRIFGSIIPAAILGRAQRRLGDIDLMINKVDKEKLLNALNKESYQFAKRQIKFFPISFVWTEGLNENLLGLNVFSGEFDADKNFTIQIPQNFKILVYAKTIEPTIYNLYNATFIGIPAVTAYYGALDSKGNPKRKYDLAVFTLKKIKKPPQNFSELDFYYRNIKLLFFYRVFCFIRNILGRISLFFGGKYDFWKW